MNIDHLVSRVSPKKLFLIDSLGAFLTAIMLGVVLAGLQNLFGMPKDILYLLSCIALIYSIYSFTCHLKIKANWAFFLKGIAIANLAYCALTIGLVIYLRSELTQLGMIYFLIEAVIIFGLVILELKTVSKLNSVSL